MTKRRILIVEDDPLFADFLATTLEEFEVRIAYDCVEAMGLIDDFKPEVIVLDLLMPAATGFSLLNELISYSDTAQLPVIVCSNATQGLNQEVLAASGVVEVIDKATMQPLDIYHRIKFLLADGD